MNNITYLKQLKEKEKTLHDKYKELYSSAKKNKYLPNVNYESTYYYDSILNDKIKQLQSLERLNNYVNTINKTNNLGKNEYKSCQHDCELIQKEINKIMKHIEEIEERIEAETGETD